MLSNNVVLYRFASLLDLNPKNFQSAVNDANQYKTTLLDNLSFQSLNLSKIGATAEFKGMLIERALHAKNNL